MASKPESSSPNKNGARTAPAPRAFGDLGTFEAKGSWSFAAEDERGFHRSKDAALSGSFGARSALPPRKRAKLRSSAVTLPRAFVLEARLRTSSLSWGAAGVTLDHVTLGEPLEVMSDFAGPRDGIGSLGCFVQQPFGTHRGRVVLEAFDEPRFLSAEEREAAGPTQIVDFDDVVVREVERRPPLYTDGPWRVDVLSAEAPDAEPHAVSILRGDALLVRSLAAYDRSVPLSRQIELDSASIDGGWSVTSHGELRCELDRAWCATGLVAVTGSETTPVEIPTKNHAVIMDVRELRVGAGDAQLTFASSSGFRVKVEPVGRDRAALLRLSIPKPVPVAVDVRFGDR